MPGGMNVCSQHASCVVVQQLLCALCQQQGACLAVGADVETDCAVYALDGQGNDLLLMQMSR